MKTRSGFVSNSSSSSFVVKYKIIDFISMVSGGHSKTPKTIYLLSTDQLKKMKRFGFKYTTVSDPATVDFDTVIKYDNYKNIPCGKWGGICLSYSVTCNQDEVMSFLFKNKIPFLGVCHYNQEIVSWNGKDDFFCQAPNVLQSCINGAELKDINFAIQRRNIKDFCKEWSDILSQE